MHILSRHMLAAVGPTGFVCMLWPSRLRLWWRSIVAFDDYRDGSLDARIKLADGARNSGTRQSKCYFRPGLRSELTRPLLELIDLSAWKEKELDQVRSKRLASHKRGRRMWNGNTAQGCCDLVPLSQLHSG